jgi:hypothetical protein
MTPGSFLGEGGEFVPFGINYLGFFSKAKMPVEPNLEPNIEIQVITQT